MKIFYKSITALTLSLLMAGCTSFSSSPSPAKQVIRPAALQHPKPTLRYCEISGQVISEDPNGTRD